MAVKLENVILSYPNLFHKSVYQGQEGKYQTGLIIEKGSRNYDLLKKEYERVVREATSGAKPKLKKNQVTPFTRSAGTNIYIVDEIDPDDGKHDDPRYRNAVICNPKSGRKPTVVDRYVSPIDDEEEIYGGCVVNAHVEIYAYNNAGYAGITTKLNGIQKIRDGERFGYTPPQPTDMFEAIEDDDMFS